MFTGGGSGGSVVRSLNGSAIRPSSARVLEISSDNIRSHTTDCVGSADDKCAETEDMCVLKRHKTSHHFEPSDSGVATGEIGGSAGFDPFGGLFGSTVRLFIPLVFR